MPKTIRIPFLGNSPILIRGSSSFLLAARAREKFPLIIETDTEELVQGVHPDDLILVSSPEGGGIAPALYLLEMVQTHHLPVIALGKTIPQAKDSPTSSPPRNGSNCGAISGAAPTPNSTCSAPQTSSPECCCTPTAKNWSSKTAAERSPHPFSRGHSPSPKKK